MMSADGRDGSALPGPEETAIGQILKGHQDRLATALALARRQQDRPALVALLDCCDTAIQRGDVSVDVHLHRGWALTGLKHWEAARAAFDQALALEPGSSEVLNNKANLLLSIGKREEALDVYTQALELDANNTSILINRGMAYIRAGRPEEARKDIDQALRLAPEDDSIIRTLLGFALPAEEPIWKELKDQHLALSTASPQLMACLIYAKTHLIRELLNSDEAIGFYRESLKLEPRLIYARLSLAWELRNLGHVQASLDILEQLYQEYPANAEILFSVSGARSDLGDTETALSMLEAAAARTGHGPLQNLFLQSHLFLHQLHGASRSSESRQEAEELGKRFMLAAGFTENEYPGRPECNHVPNSALRVGFVSGDLRVHPVGLMLSHILEASDPKRITPFLYCNGHRPDWIQRKLRLLCEAHGGVHRSIDRLSDHAAALMIEHDGIDILIDLAGHTDRNRLSLFAFRPAAVQISWLGYFSTTGLPTMDFVILDPWHKSPQAEASFSERILLLEPNRFCYTPIPGTPPLSPPPVDRCGRISFGSFNNTTKLNRETLTLWRRILAAVPNSQLILKWLTFNDASYCDRIRAFFAEAGISSERIVLRGISRHLKMLAQYGDLDIALDPFPYCGGYTSLEALWMGVPIITLPGERVVSRQTLSFLACVEALELVARDQDHYVELAVALANDPERLRIYREQLRPRMAASALCQPKPFAEQFTTLLERAYATIRAEVEAGTESLPG